MLNRCHCIGVAARSIKVQGTATFFTQSTGSIENNCAYIHRHATLLFWVAASEHHGHPGPDDIYNVWILVCAVATMFPYVADQFCRLTACR